MFSLALKGDGVVPHGCEVVAIMRRRDVSVEDGDVTLKQITSGTFAMEQFLIVKEDGVGDVSTEEAVEAGENLCRILNEMSIKSKANFDKFEFQGDVTKDSDDDDLHALDYYAITREVVAFAKQYYSDELQRCVFYKNDEIVEALFERKSNVKNVEFTMNRYG